MAGAASLPEPPPGPSRAPSPPMLAVEALTVLDDKALTAVRELSLAVGAGEILGVAGVSGNGQRELVETLAGQRSPEAGLIRMAGERYRPTRGQMRRRRVFVLPEEPLSNACVRTMTIAENLAFRNFDEPPIAVTGGFLSRRALRDRGRELIDRFKIRAAGPDASPDTLSGGNVQRTVLARGPAQSPKGPVAPKACARPHPGRTARTSG